MKKTLSRVRQAVLFVCFFAVAVVAYFYFSCSVEREYTTSHVEIGSNYAGIFTDRNALQLTAADRMGIAPQEDEANIARFVKEGKLVKLNSCRYYVSTASMPYLTPEAADLLAEVGRRYKKELGSVFKVPVVTSMFRTREYVKDLQKRNGNAVKNSCHLRGTTFDITYARMNAKEKRAMAQTLADLRNAGYCYVVYEIGQPCFHITVRK